ncbi:unnamed protein product, partial [Closterium sp. NIES-54]
NRSQLNRWNVPRLLPWQTGAPAGPAGSAVPSLGGWCGEDHNHRRELRREPSSACSGRNG